MSPAGKAFSESTPTVRRSLGPVGWQVGAVTLTVAARNGNEGTIADLTGQQANGLADFLEEITLVLDVPALIRHATARVRA